MFRAFLQRFLCAAFSCTVALHAQAAGKDEEAEFGVLVAGRGAEETFIYCTACHSERIVAQQGLTREDWIEVLDWMVEEQDMEVIDEPDYTAVVDYLARNYGIDRPNFPMN